MVPVEITGQSQLVNQGGKSSPGSESYYHAMLGLQYEAGSASSENSKKALKEYIIALKYDPNAFFLLKRVAFLYNRFGNHKDALFYAERAQQLDPTNGQLMILLGDIYIASGETEKGFRTYKEGLQFVSDNKRDVYFKIAGIYAEQGDLAKAEKLIYQGIEIGPPSPFAHYFLGMLALEKGLLTSGLEFYREALLLDPYFEPAHMGIAMIHERQRDVRAAIKVYWHVVNRINPKNRQAVNRLVHLLVQERSLDDALDLLTRLYRDDPSNLNTALQLSRVFVEKEEFPNAIKAVLPVIAAKPGDMRLLVHLATLYEKNDEIEKALSVYKEVLKQNPSAYDARIRLGSLYFYKLKNTSKALAQGELAKKIDPQRVESYLFTGLVLHDSERYRDAAKILSLGIERNPKVPDLHFHLGATFDKLKRFDDMVHEMEQTIDLAPRHANALNYLGYTFADKGIRLSEAIDLIRRAIAVKPDDGYFIDSLGWAYYRKGNFEDALPLLKKAVSLIPGDPVIHEHLGEVYLKNNLLDLARESWERSLELDPENDHLIARFRNAGFGQPSLGDSFQKTETHPQSAH